MLFEFLSLDYVFLRCWTIFFPVEFKTFFSWLYSIKIAFLDIHSLHTSYIIHTPHYTPRLLVFKKNIQYYVYDIHLLKWKIFKWIHFHGIFAAHLFIVRNPRVIILANNNEYAHTFLSNFTTVNKATLVHSKNHWYLTIGNSVVWKSKPYEVMRNIVNDVLNEKWHWKKKLWKTTQTHVSIY